MRRNSTLYDVLGVSKEASEQEIRSAFRRLTMEKHPDRFTGEARQRAEDEFQVLTEAFNVLSRPEARAKYDKEISTFGSGPVMDRREIARRLAAKGAQSYRAGQLGDAIENLEQAVDHDDENARAHYFLGIILARSGGREREGLRHLDRAVQLEPNNSTMKGEAATLFLASGLRNRAARLAEEALALDPTNTKATEVVQQIAAEERPQGEGGLLGRFLRKG